uniref:Uncharacterized protein LOC107425315 isoform X3 n=1 Tax=Rhizophora mucronata TaxID=61149 RepID=A0A2P2KTX6_RHIMU
MITITTTLLASSPISSSSWHDRAATSTSTTSAV